jgi:hypothetical protein
MEEFTVYIPINKGPVIECVPTKTGGMTLVDRLSLGINVGDSAVSPHHVKVPIHQFLAEIFEIYYNKTTWYIV